MRRVLGLLTGLIVIAGIAMIVQKTHPILLKYIFKSARIIGKPIEVCVFTDGYLNKGIKVYKDPQYPNEYILSLNAPDEYGMLKYIDVDLDHDVVGRSICTATDCYDTINGRLFQSEVGEHFVDFKDDMKGYHFDPHLTFTPQEIKFNIPPKQLNFDSVRIAFNKIY